MALSDYLGRTFDVLAFRGARAAGEILLTQSLFSADAPGEICVGIQKLAQRWLLHFATPKGSLPYDPEFGTTFMTAALNGQLMTETDVQAEFNFAAIDAQRAMAAEETDDDPADEKLQGASLDKIIIDQDSVSIRVFLQSQAGATRTAILPVPVLPMSLGV